MSPVRLPKMQLKGQLKRPYYSLCILSGELAGTKISADNLFSLPMGVIMGESKKPSSGRKVARGA